MPDGTATPIFARADRNSVEPEPQPQPGVDDVWAAVARLFNAAFDRLDKIDARFTEFSQRLDALEAKAAQPPAARIVKHVRNTDGAIVKSILVSDGQ